jgi:hypothetical protein
VSRRLLGAGLLLLAGVTAVVATFLPLYWQGSDFGDSRLGFTTTAWEVTTDTGSIDVDVMLGRSPQYGVPIVIAALLLVLAAALVLLPEHQRLVARYTAIGGTGLLVGSVWTTGMVVAASVSTNPDSDLRNYREHVGAGTWVLVASAVVAVVGAVLVHARRVEPSTGGPVVYRVEDGEDGDGDETETPPFGVPVASVEVAQIPETGYERRDGPGGVA